MTPGEPAAGVEADGVQLEQVLMNLIQNALVAVTGQPDARRQVGVATFAEVEGGDGAGIGQ